MKNNEKNKNKVSRLLLYDLKNNLKTYCLLFFEIIFSIILLSVVLAYGGVNSNIKKSYKDINNITQISIEKGEIQDNNELKRFYNENEIGIINNYDMNDKYGKEPLKLLTYNDVVVKNIDIRIKNGSDFTLDYSSGICEVILNEQYSDKYHIGDIISVQELTFFQVPNIDKLKVVGYVSEDMMAFDGAYSTVYVGAIVNIGKVSEQNIYYSQFNYVFTPINAYDYNLPMELKSAEQLYQHEAMSTKQIYTMFTIFAFIAIAFLASTLLTYYVISYNNNLKRHILIKRIGVENKNIIFVRSLIVLSIILICSLIAFAFMPILNVELIKSVPLYIFSNKFYLYSVLLVGGAYFLSEAITLLVISYNSTRSHYGK